MDGWLRAHIAVDSPARGPFSMGYLTGADIPFHWALAGAFTLCDCGRAPLTERAYPLPATRLVMECC